MNDTNDTNDLGLFPDDLRIESDEQVIEWCNAQIPKMKEVFDSFVRDFNRNWKLEHSEQDGVLKLQGVTLDPHIKKVEKLDGYDEFPSFQLTDWKIHPSSRFHPEEAEDVPISVHSNPIDAIYALIKFVVNLELKEWHFQFYEEPDFSDEEY